MAFSDQAIGFYLQMEDEMTPQFKGIVSKYQKFVGRMEQLSDRLAESVDSSMQQFGISAKAMAKGKAFNINVQLSPKSRKSLAQSVSMAVATALAGAKFRFRAAMPQKLSKIFSQDVALRQFYKDIPQPPDMLGGIQRFAEGGKVPESGGRKGKDSVLSLLTPGEVVVPTDLVAKLEDAFEQVRGRKGVIEAGFGSKEDVTFYNKSLHEIASAMDALAEATKDAGIEAKTRLSPQVVNLREQFTQLTKAEDEASEEADNFLSKVLGPARFIAIQTSLRSLQDGFHNISGGFQRFAGDVGAGEFQSFPDRLREIRQRLGLSAESAVQFTGAIAESSKELGTSFFKSLEATDALIEKGVKDQKLLIEQSALLARANRVTGADFGMLADSVRLYRTELKGSAEGFDAIMLSIDQMTKSSDLAVNTPELMESLVAALNNPVLRKEGPAAIQNYVNNLLGLRAAAETVWQGETGIEKIFADALGGVDVQENLTKIAFLTKGQISDMQSLQAALTSKGGLVGAFSALAEEVQRNINNPAALDQLGKAIGVDGKFLMRLQEFTSKQKTSTGLAVPLEESATAGDKMAESLERMTSAAERLNNTIANFVGSSGPMQTLVEFLDQVPVIALLAAAHLGGTLLGSVLRLGKGVAGLVGGIGGAVFGKLGKFGGIFGGKGSGAGGALGGAGALAGGATGPGILAAGAKIALVLAAIGTVLLLIGGHADDLMPILEATLPGLMKLAKFVAEEVSIGIVDTLTSLAGIFAPLAPMGPQFEAAAGGMMSAAKFLGSFALVGAELALLGTAATIADGIGKILDVFGIKSPMQALQEQGGVVVDTLLNLSVEFSRLAPLAERVPKLQAGLAGSTALMSSLQPLLESAADLGDAAGALGDGWFTTGPLSNLRTQAEPMIDTITDLTTWFTRVQTSSKALAGVDYARTFFSKLAVAVGAMQQVGAVDMLGLQRAGNVLSSVSMSQPSAQPLVSKEQIDQLTSIVVQAGEASPLHKDLTVTNDLLMQLLDAVKEKASDKAASLPTRAAMPTPRVLDSMTRDIVGFNK